MGFADADADASRFSMAGLACVLQLLCCDGPCLQSFHLSCKGLDDATLPEGKWYCSPECQRGEVRRPRFHIFLPSPSLRAHPLGL
jgi:hypothetical protein